MDTMYQISLLQSLTGGLYDGLITVADLKKLGDYAIGTFDGADGELIMIDRVCYKALLDGSIIVANDKETIPFSNAFKFNKSDSLTLSCKNIKDLKEKLHKFKNEKYLNHFMIIKIKGHLNSITTRSLPKQTKPYTNTLDYIVEHEQTLKTDYNTDGTIIGICFPPFMDKLNTTDFHMHFISKNKLFGGHILDLSFDDLTVEVSIKSEFKLILSKSDEFVKKEINSSKELIKKVEE